MSIRALDQLLGRSTIDPRVAEAYEHGRIEEILAEYAFPPEMLRALRGLEAETFDEFASLALDLISRMKADSQASNAPDPRQGLCIDTVVGDEEQAA
jgi:hypothetical protein